MPRSPRRQTQTRTRTCVGCGTRDLASRTSGLVRVVTREGELAFDLSGRFRGRGAYVHARPRCLQGAARGLSRVLRVSPDVAGTAGELASRLAVACGERTTALLRNAFRVKSARIGKSEGPSADLDAAVGSEPLTIVAVDAGAAASSPAVLRAVASGRALAWGARRELGAALGVVDAPFFAVENESIAAELIRTHAAASAASVVTQETTQRSRRPEAR